MCGKTFSIYGVHIPRKSLNLCFFYACPSSGRIVWKSVSTKIEGVDEAMICSIKIQSENMKMTWNISLFPFGTIAIFLNVMALATIL